MPVSKQASYRPPCPRSPSTALIGIDGLLTKIRDCIPHKNKENSHAVQQLETITFLGGGHSFHFNGRTLRVQNAAKQSKKYQKKNYFLNFCKQSAFLEGGSTHYRVPDKTGLRGGCTRSSRIGQTNRSHVKAHQAPKPPHFRLNTRSNLLFNQT